MAFILSDKEFDLVYTIYNDWFHQIVQYCDKHVYCCILTSVGPGTNQLPLLLLTHFPLFELLFNMKKKKMA